MSSNGLGPSWFPDWLREWLTWFGSFFFNEASWEKHDKGYDRGYPSRAICDRKFLQAMLRDASRVKTIRKIAACVTLAWFFWLMVRLFGWLTYNKTPTDELHLPLDREQTK